MGCSPTDGHGTYTIPVKQGPPAAFWHNRVVSNPGWGATAAKVSFEAVTILSDREPQQETQYNC